MAYTIIDRTLNGKRSSGSRSKFVRRVKNKIKEQIKEQIAEGNVDDLVSGQGKKVTVPKKDLSQPIFRHGLGGKHEGVYTGNKEFVQGDRINRPPSSEGKGSAASDRGDGEDDFEFTLTHEEFLDMFFEDCELPDLRETVISKTDKFKMKRAGFSTDGPSAQLNIPRTMTVSKGRRIGLLRKSKKRRLTELELEEASLVIDIAELKDTDPKSKKIGIFEIKLDEIRNEIMVLRRKLRAVPFIDDVDLRYNRYEKRPIPTIQAVMGCILDVSGSMGQREKELAKRYFMLLYLFLTKSYKRVEVVWIRHHTVAKEVDEKEFFYSKESGGTLVSTALEKMSEIIKTRYPPSEWNIYVSQASDGDNWKEDTHVAIDLMQNSILPICQYYTYIEISKGERSNVSDLWPYYETLSKQHSNFQMKKVKDASEIFPVFKQLFSKRRRVAKHEQNAA